MCSIYVPISLLLVVTKGKQKVHCSFLFVEAMCRSFGASKAWMAGLPGCVKTRSCNNGREFFSALHLASEQNGGIPSGSFNPEVNIPMDFSAREFSHGLLRRP
jgi:hypothetical protein